MAYMIMMMMKLTIHKRKLFNSIPAAKGWSNADSMV